MDLIKLTPLDLSIAAALVLALAALSLRFHLGVGRQLVIAGARATIQLGLIGMVLKVLFEKNHPGFIALLASVMLLAAGYEVMARQSRRFVGLWSIGIGTLSMFISSFSVAILALAVIIQPSPWYMPQYLIPLLGMLLGNTMSGIAISLQDLTRNTVRERGAIEARLLLGHTWTEAIAPLRRDALRA